MVIIIDNYDSFVYNIAQYIGELGWQPLVFRNDQVQIEEIEKLNPTHIIISPGPCTPLEAGVSNDVIKNFAGKIPILGICLGHQCIGHVYGGKIIKADVPTHGKHSLVYHDERTVYKGLPNPFEAGRYHSLVISRKGFPAELELTARTSEGVIMGVRHKDHVVEGVQFHPESIMTHVGYNILINFLNYSAPRLSKD